MLDIKFIRENPQIVKKSVEDRQLGGKVDVDELLRIDSEHRELLQKVENHRALKNQLSQDVSEAPGEREKLVKEATQVKQELSTLESKLEKVKEKFDSLLYQVPNLIADDVKVGKDESDNEILRTWGEPTKFDFEPKDHLEIGEKLDIIDVKSAAKVSGARFNYLKNEAVLLQFALINFVFNKLTDEEIIGKLAKSVKNPSVKPFVPVLPPVIIKEEVAKKMDRFDPIEDRYYLEKDGQLFVGSAEHTLGPMHMDQVLGEEDLPVRYIGYSTVFRREAGTYGKDTRGMFRVHQYDKAEIESFTLPENGPLEQDFIVAILEYFVQQLEIPYRVVVLCTGEMGKPDYKQVDIECWFPGQDRYRETHTSDYMTDFQSRGLNTKYKKDSETGFVHMNDATAFALGRTIIAILENFQQKDGSVKVPKVLHPYMNGLTEIVRK